MSISERNSRKFIQAVWRRKNSNNNTSHWSLTAFLVKQIGIWNQIMQRYGKTVLPFCTSLICERLSFKGSFKESKEQEVAAWIFLVILENVTEGSLQPNNQNSLNGRHWQLLSGPCGRRAPFPTCKRKYTSSKDPVPGTAKQIVRERPQISDLDQLEEVLSQKVLLPKRMF